MQDSVRQYAVDRAGGHLSASLRFRAFHAAKLHSIFRLCLLVVLLGTLNAVPWHLAVLENAGEETEDPMPSVKRTNARTVACRKLPSTNEVTSSRVRLSMSVYATYHSGPKQPPKRCTIILAPSGIAAMWWQAQLTD